MLAFGTASFVGPATALANGVSIPRLQRGRKGCICNRREALGIPRQLSPKLSLHSLK